MCVWFSTNLYAEKLKHSGNNHTTVERLTLSVIKEKGKSTFIDAKESTIQPFRDDSHQQTSQNTDEQPNT